MIDKGKFTYSPLGKAFENQTKTIEELGGFSRASKTLTSKDYHEDNYREIFEELVKERCDEIKELTNEINYFGLKNYFTGRNC